MAIVLEYFPTAVNIDIDNVSEKLADVAVRGICGIHAAYVWHGDIHPRNILVLPDADRPGVVWIDFDHSVVTAYEPRFNRLFLREEASIAWACMYQELVSTMTCDCSIYYTQLNDALIAALQTHWIQSLRHRYGEL